MRRLVYCLRVLYPHGTSAKPARGTMHTLQQSSEVVAAAAVADSDAPEVVAAGTGACLSSSSSSSLLLLLLLLTRGCRDSVWVPTEWLTARRNYRRLHVSAAVEWWQQVRFFLGPTDVQPVAICLIWCRVVRSRDFSVTRQNVDGIHSYSLVNEIV